jgi:hypothetical protein
MNELMAIRKSTPEGLWQPVSNAFMSLEDLCEVSGLKKPRYGVFKKSSTDNTIASLELALTAWKELRKAEDQYGPY